MLKATFYGDSNVGMVRQNNEDSLISRPLWGGRYVLLAAIDGMGGFDCGEVAAETARSAIEGYLDRFKHGDPSNLLTQAVVEANNAVVRKKEEMGLTRMGCVLTAALVDLDKRQIHMAHVGDSRMYRYSEGELVKLSHDHSVVGYQEEIGALTEEEAMHHPRRNVIERYAGNVIHMLGDPNFLETSSFPIVPGSQLLLCSDGLSDVLTSAEIKDVLCQPQSPKWKVETLIDRTNAKGGKDNITVVILQFDGKPGPRRQKVVGSPSPVPLLSDAMAFPQKKPGKRVLGLLATGIILGVAAFAGGYYTAVTRERCLVRGELDNLRDLAVSKRDSLAVMIIHKADTSAVDSVPVDSAHIPMAAPVIPQTQKETVTPSVQ